jgi:uncharacterized protein (TIGR02145 family)
MTEPLANDNIFISKLTEITLANLGNESFDVRELAQELGVSHHTLRRRLQVITNKTITQFIREIRLNKALEMLQSGKVTSTDVAYRVGFSSPAYFNTCFHEYYGYPPGKVKKTDIDHNNEIKSSQATSVKTKKSPAWRIFLYISAGILMLSASLYLVHNHFSGNFSSDLAVSAKHSGKTISNKKYDYKILRDIEGNEYGVVTIGKQVWMAENLKSTRYNDGTAIPLVVDNSAWGSRAGPAYCWYNNDSARYAETYGPLYNYFTVDPVINGGKNVCPAGWHVPTNSDWNTLFNFLEGEYFAGGKLKESGSSHWVAPNIGATNETGFSALPSGGRNMYGNFYGFGEYNGWWSPPESGAFRSLASGRIWVYVSSCHETEGFSIRCIKDN